MHDATRHEPSKTINKAPNELKPNASQIKVLDFLLKNNESKISVENGISAKMADVEIVDVCLRAINIKTKYIE